MAKGTVIFLSILAVIALLLLGINIGKKIGTPSSSNITQTTQPTLYNSQPTVYVPSPTVAPTVANQSTITNQNMSTFTDSSCGYSFSYPGSFMRQETVNKKSAIYVDPNNPKNVIAATCETTLPRPPLSSETVTLAGVTGTLYHDTDTNGNQRDEIFVKHPTSGMEIVIAGYGEIFQTIRSTFKFVQ
jgi:hypothetical protein